MSVTDLKKSELREIADKFVLDVEDNAGVADLRKAVATLDVNEVALDFPQYAEALKESDEPEETEEKEESKLITSQSLKPKTDDAEEQTEEEAKEAKSSQKKAPQIDKDVCLVKMTRNNPVYEVRGYRFTRNNPFVLVNNDDVDFLIEVEGGFAVAKPSEVESFYDR